MRARWHLAGLFPIAFGLLTVALCIISVVIRYNDMPRVAAPGERTVTLGVGAYFLHADGPANCTIHDAAGATVAVTAPHTQHWFSFPSADLETWIPVPGDYVVTCTTPGKVSIGRDLGVTLLIGGLALGLGMIGGVIVLLAMRKRDRLQPTAAG